MHWIDWIIVILPLCVVAFIGLKTQRYVKSVADFLTAGRVAGRYVLSVARAEAGMGLISVVAMFEVYYSAGFAFSFWGQLGLPIYTILGLTGFCIYRFRETRAMTLGQFLELRYSRAFRIFAAILQTVSGVINYAIFPAVGARFLIYFCDLPLELHFFGMICPTFAVVMAVFLSVAVFVATRGGQITIMVTDCVQGILSYPVYAVLVAYIIYRFSWSNDMAPVLLDRPVGKSMLNPFGISELRDFNLFYVIIGIMSNVLATMAWSGTQGYTTAAKNPHEQKMGNVLSVWRTGFSVMMFVLLAVAAYTFLNSAKFTGGDKGSLHCRNALARKAFEDVAGKEAREIMQDDYETYLATGTMTPALEERIERVRRQEKEDAVREAASFNKYSRQDIPEIVPEKSPEQQAVVPAVDKEPMLTVGRDTLKSVSRKDAQVFGVIFGQMRVPMALKYILPVGMVGMFCALCIFFLISTDTTYLHSWSCIIVQDLVLPLRGKPMTPRKQLALLRITIAVVAVFAFGFSFLFGQVDYIQMFFAITGAIWLGGAGACIVGGLYWKRGTTAGAWAALLAGSSIAVGGILCQQLWVDTLYPWISRNGMLEIVTRVIEGASLPFEPYILWRVRPNKFPINSQEIYGMSMLMSVSLYIVVSLLTCRSVFNLDRMLHRGKYKREGKVIRHRPRTVKEGLLAIIGINEEYTKGDKILAWSVFIYSFGWTFLVCFVAVAVWNTVKPWPDAWWSHWFFIQNFVIAGIIAVVSTVWFTIGGTRDLRRLFKSLKAKEVDILDDGRVVGHISTSDVALVEEVEHINIEEDSK